MEKNCLVTKLKESIDDNSLRYLNGLRLHINSRGDNSEALTFSVLTNSEKEITYKIIEGDAELFKGTTTESLGTEASVVANKTYNISTKLYSDDAVILIKNFNDAIYIGKEGSLYTGAQNANRPFATIKTEELRYFPTEQINVGKACVITGDIGKIYLPELTYLEMNQDSYGNGDDLTFYGELKKSFMPSLEKIIIRIIGSDSNNSIEFNVEDLTHFENLTTLNFRGGICTGGDLYQLFLNKSEIDFTQVFGRGISPECTYQSGDAIPNCNIKNFNLNRNSYKMEKDDIISLLTLFRDGDGKGITLPDNSIRIETSTEIANDSIVLGLVNDLSNLGKTITLGPN